MAGYKPSYVKALKAWARHKLTGKGVALKQPIRSTYKAKKYLRWQMGIRRGSYSIASKLFKK